MKISVAGLGYVGLSNAVLLAQKNEVYALDVDASRVAMVNERKSPIVDGDLEEFFANDELNLTATIEPTLAYVEANFGLGSLFSLLQANKQTMISKHVI